MSTLSFLGAAGTVTGSKHLIEGDGKKILVDCGLFQGLKKLRQLNWSYLPVNASELDCVVLTHGHLDHTGFLPRLVDMGFRGPIYGTGPTLEIAEIILRDSARLQEEEAERANRGGYSKHHPAKPLYTSEDVGRTLEMFTEIPVGEWTTIVGSIPVRVQYNGHIIGATFVEMDLEGKRFVFSGDIGRLHDPLMYPPKKPERADVLLIESTYGDRRHPENSVKEDLAEVVNSTVAAGGTLIIPSFAVERTQTLMYLLWQLYNEGKIPDIPMIMDSPMGRSVLRVFQHNLDWHKLNSRDCAIMCGRFRIVEEYSETEEIIKDRQPKIVIAGSGMITGGRVLSYLFEYISKPETTVLLVGYQAEGTRGRALLDGAEELKFYGQYHQVQARVASINGLSSHADQHELLDWLSDIQNQPETVYMVHGEPCAADALRLKIHDTYGWKTEVPELWEQASF